MGLPIEPSFEHSEVALVSCCVGDGSQSFGYSVFDLASQDIIGGVFVGIFEGDREGCDGQDNVLGAYVSFDGLAVTPGPDVLTFIWRVDDGQGVTRQTFPEYVQHFLVPLGFLLDMI